MFSLKCLLANVFVLWLLVRSLVRSAVCLSVPVHPRLEVSYSTVPPRHRNIKAFCLTGMTGRRQNNHYVSNIGRNL